MQKKKIWFHERSLASTFVFILAVVLLFLASFFAINGIMEDRCLRRMEEGADTVIEEVTSKLNRDSSLVNAAAAIISASDDFSPKALIETMGTITPLMETMRMRILMPDNTVIQADGTIVDGTGYISFEDEAPLGEHVSDRMTSVLDGNTLVLRHYVPIENNGEIVAILYGVTTLEELPTIMNIDNIYNASASVYIIDTSTGDYLMDTWHSELGSIYDLVDQKIRSPESPEEILERILHLEQGDFAIWSELTDQWLYYYYAPVGINEWAVGVSVPQSVAFAALYAVQRVFWTLAAILAVAIFLYYLRVRSNAIQMTQEAVERAVLEEKLHKAEVAERAKTTFLTNMSHDIRTPMNAIIGFTTLAQTNLDNKERVRDYLKKIMSSSNHLLSLINDILDMSRIESGKLNIDEKECSISDIFRDMRNIIQSQMQAQHLNFFMDTIDVTDENIYCDKLHINQVLLNLLSNAIKFTPAGGSVALSIRQHPDAPTGYGAYEIRVKDTGIGISEEFAEHIFEPFERERTSTASGVQGTGLGMAITKSIVDAMGGTIDVKTEQGRGTEFILNFKFRLQTGDRQTTTIQELMGRRALVVDDSFETCDSVTKMLTKIGLRAEWTMHGKEATLRAHQALEMEEPFFAFIIDWVLPDINGIEVARQLRAVAGEKPLIIILTAYDWTPYEEEAKQIGVTAFCNKPIFISDLRDVLLATSKVGEPVEEPAIIPELDLPDGKTRLLLVEDNELNREIAEEILCEAGFDVETAEDGKIAVDMVGASAPGYYSLVLMDIQMPIMNGYDATMAIRALPNPELAKIPIVAMTANAFEEDRQHALEVGMNDHIAKPINVVRLMDVLQQILGDDMPKEAE